MRVLKLYDVEINGHATTIQLTEDEARKRGLTAQVPESKQAAAPNKARAASNKAKG